MTTLPTGDSILEVYRAYPCERAAELFEACVRYTLTKDVTRSQVVVLGDMAVAPDKSASYAHFDFAAISTFGPREHLRVADHTALWKLLYDGREITASDFQRLTEGAVHLDPDCHPDAQSLLRAHQSERTKSPH